MTRIETVYTRPDGQRRVRIIHDERGWYSFVEEVFSDDPLEMVWIPLMHRRSKPKCDSLATAIREARGRVEWLNDVMKSEA